MDLQHEEAEKAVLGSMMVSDQIPVQVLGTGIRKHDFYLDRHQYLFQVIERVFGEKSTADTLMVCERAKTEGLLEKVGGQNYIFQLAEQTAAPGNASLHAEVLIEKSRRRQLNRAFTELADRVTDPENSVGSLVEEAMLGLNPDQSSSYRSVSEVLEEVVEQFSEGGLKALPSGYPALDQKIRGFPPSTLTLIAARPSVGKSVLAAEIARKAALSGKPTLFCSLEMSATELMMRMIAAESGVSLTSLLSGKVPQSKWKKINQACNTLDRIPLWIDETPASHLVLIESRARALQASKGLDLILVDYLQQMSCPSEPKLTDFERVGRISTGLKAMSANLKVPVIAVSQLSRAPEARPDKTPRLSDLRQSGQLEQDADLVILLHREVTDDEEGDDSSLNVIIAKQRNGPVGDLKLEFDRRTTSIR